jgi:hypothetical protein
MVFLIFGCSETYRKKPDRKRPAVLCKNCDFHNISCHEKAGKNQTSATKSRMRTPNALAILTIESIEGDSTPRSMRLMKTVDKPAFSASFSWLNPDFARLARTVSPKIRRCGCLADMTLLKSRKPKKQPCR